MLHHDVHKKTETHVWVQQKKMIFWTDLSYGSRNIIYPYTLPGVRAVLENSPSFFTFVVVPVRGTILTWKARKGLE